MDAEGKRDQFKRRKEKGRPSQAGFVAALLTSASIPKKELRVKERKKKRERKGRNERVAEASRDDPGEPLARVNEGSDEKEGGRERRRASGSRLTQRSSKVHKLCRGSELS